MFLCDECIHDIQGCCDYDEPLGRFCVEGSAFQKKEDTMANESTLYKFKTAVDNQVNSWRRADRLTELEQRAHAQEMIYGIVYAALHVLPTKQYRELVEYVHDQGFNH